MKTKKELEKEIEGLKKQLEEAREFRIKPELVTDENVIMGIGGAKLDIAKIKVVRINIDYLKKAIKVFETIGNEDIDLAIQKDFPLFLGRVNEEGEFNGIIIAPKLVD